jgi:hypothetical protein
MENLIEVFLKYICESMQQLRPFCAAKLTPWSLLECFCGRVYGIVYICFACDVDVGGDEAAVGWVMDFEDLA